MRHKRGGILFATKEDKKNHKYAKRHSKSYRKKARQWKKDYNKKTGQELLISRDANATQSLVDVEPQDKPIETTGTKDRDKKRKERILFSKRKIDKYYFKKYGIIARSFGHLRKEKQLLIPNMEILFEENSPVELVYKGVKINASSKLDDIYYNNTLSKYYDESLYVDLDNPIPYIRFFIGGEIDVYLHFDNETKYINKAKLVFCGNILGRKVD